MYGSREKSVRLEWAYRPPFGGRFALSLDTHDMLSVWTHDIYVRVSLVVAVSTDA